MRRTSIVGILCVILHSSFAQAEKPAFSGLELRAGPAEDPFSHADFGGTPDLEVPGEVGLTKGEVEELFEQLESPRLETRREAARRLKTESVGAEQMLREILWRGVDATNRQLRGAIRDARNGEGKPLEALLAMDPGKGPGVRGAAKVMALLEALEGLDTLAAYKVLMEFAPRHAAVFRPEIGEMMTDRGLAALPALVYGRGAEDEEVQMFAVARIRDMGDPPMSEQVEIKNPRRLAQLMEAYASINDLEIIDVILSMTNHDSLFVRTAARRCLERFGGNVKWPARRTYENTLGSEPPEDMGTAQILEALYRFFDEKRLERMHDLFTEGSRALESGDYPAMGRAYREILLRQPMYPGRAEMARGFVQWGLRLEETGNAKSALRAYRLAARVAAPESDSGEKAVSRLKWLRAEALLREGLADVELYHSVVETDPGNLEAAARLDMLEGRSLPWGELLVKSALVGFLAFLAAGLVCARIRATR